MESILLSIELKVENLNKQLCVPLVKRRVQNSRRQIGLMAFLTKPVRSQRKQSSSVFAAQGREPCPLLSQQTAPVFALPALVNTLVCSRPYNITMHNNLSLLFMAFLQSPYF